jgi:hypothetical protein
MMNWHEVRDSSNELFQQRLSDAAQARLARRVAKRAPVRAVSGLRAWLAQALVAGARRLDSRSEAPRYETGGKEAY